MSPGDIVLLPVPQFRGGPPKLRPALVLALLPGPYQNVLTCGVSTQLQLIEKDWNEMIEKSDPDFPQSKLHRSSVIRLSYLFAADRGDISGIMGSIASDRLQRLRTRLSQLLQ
jgi:mRNA interferase MazF